MILTVLLISFTNIKVYFYRDTLYDKLAYFISRAIHSLDICFHQFYDPEVIDSTLTAYNRGVKVRVITEHDYYNEYELQRLVDAGIPVIDEGYGANSVAHRMHNKFIIRDFRDNDTINDAVWVGSFNASGYTHADNAISVRSHALAVIFENEFNQMWGDTDNTPNSIYARTGSNKREVNAYHQVIVEGVKFEVYFSPYNTPSHYVLTWINNAQRELDFLMFAFTRYDIYDAMGNRFIYDSVIVNGVMEGSISYNRSAYDYFQAHNIPVFWDNFNSGNGSFLHEKILIVDDSLVLMGSYNWTMAADTSNDESMVIIHSPEIASLYKQEFIRRYEETGHIYYVAETRGKSKAYHGKLLSIGSIKGIDLTGRRVRTAHAGVIFKQERGRWVKVLLVK